MKREKRSLVVLGVLLAFSAFLLAVPSSAFAVEKGTLRATIHWSPSRDWVDPAISGWNVSGFFTLYMFHDALIKPMPEGILAPCLAESWTHNDRYTVWDFKLRQGVKFHNGDEVTADDAVFTFQRYQGHMSKFIHEKIQALEAVSRYHFRVTLKEPYLDFLDIFLPGESTIGWVVPKKYVEKVGDVEFKRNPIGAGPFRYVEFEPGQRITGEAFEGFWRKKPKIKRLEIVIVREPSTRYAMVTRGEVDIATLMVDVFYKKIKEDPKLRVAVPKSPSTYFVNWVQQWNPKSPWADIRVRKAASLSLNRQSLVDVHSPGSDAMGTLGLTGFPGTLPNPPDPYDPKRAKELLAEAGYPNGLDGGIFYPRNGPYWPLGEQMINDWKAVGIHMKGIFLDRAAQYQAFKAGKFKDGNFLDNASAATISARLGYVFLPPYWGGYPDIDKLWDEYKHSFDPAVRVDRIMRIQKLLYDKRVFTPTQQLNSPAALGPRIKGNPYLIQSPYPVWVICPMEDLELNE